MSAVLEDGRCRVHQSLARPDRGLLMGCDRNKVYDVITFCAIAIFVFHTWYSILFGVIAMPVALGFLRMLGKKHPYFFAIYKRQRRTQAVYKRAATMHAPLPRIPQQQQS